MEKLALGLMAVAFIAALPQARAFSRPLPFPLLQLDGPQNDVSNDISYLLPKRQEIGYLNSQR